jgi:hypothetical protein
MYIHLPHHVRTWRRDRVFRVHGTWRCSRALGLLCLSYWRGSTAVQSTERHARRSCLCCFNDANMSCSFTSLVRPSALKSCCTWALHHLVGFAIYPIISISPAIHARREHLRDILIRDLNIARLTVNATISSSQPSPAQQSVKNERNNHTSAH